MARLNSILTAYFTQKNIQDVVLKSPKPHSPIRDLLFPVSATRQKASPFIAKSEVQNATGAIPIVKRGVASYPVNAGEVETDLIQPEGFRPSVFVSAVEMNDNRAMQDPLTLNAMLTEKVEMLRDRVTVSTEILCAQALSGTIKYPAVSSGADTEYTVQLGTPKKMADTDIKGKAFAVLQANLEQQFLEQVKTGAATDVCFLAGTEAYAEIVKIIAATSSPNLPVRWEGAGVVLHGKYKILPISATYALPGKSDATAVIDPKTIKTIDLANAGKLFYLALDDFDARLAPMPFFAKYVKADDPSGYKIIAMSKPLPALAVSKTVDRKYLA